MFYSILLNLKSLFLYRKRYLVSQILTFTALGFVVLTAAKVIAAHSEVADFANTNIYTFAIREDAHFGPQTSLPLLNGFEVARNRKTTSSKSLQTRPGRDSWLLVGATHLWMNSGINGTWKKVSEQRMNSVPGWIPRHHQGDEKQAWIFHASLCKSGEDSYTVAGVVDAILHNMARLEVPKWRFHPPGQLSRLRLSHSVRNAPPLSPAQRANACCNRQPV